MMMIHSHNTKLNIRQCSSV